MLGKYSRFSLLVVLVVVLTQCQTLSLDMQKSGTMPHVTIDGVYRDQVVSACTDVLKENDFRFTASRGASYLYEKPGSTMDFLAWGGFSTDQEIVIRLAVYIRELGDAYEVECQPFLVTRPGEHMEDARKQSRFKSGKYQKLLNQVKERVYEGGSPAEDWEAWD